MPITIHTASWLVNPHREALAGGAIAVQDGVVISVGTSRELCSALPAATVTEHPGCAIIPGFVNAHTHLELTHFPAWREQNGMGYAPRSFVDWIIQLIKINRGLTPEQLQASLKEGLRKCLQSGTTSIGDILSRYELLPNYSSSPMGGRIFFELLGHETKLFEARLHNALAVAKNMNPLGQMLPAFSPHAPYTIAEEHLPQIREAALKCQFPLAIHLSESAEETSFMFDTAGRIAEEFYPFIDWQSHLSPPRRCTSTDYFDRNGLLTDKTMAIHCVHLTFADAQTIKKRASTICLCPRSNDRLDVGRAPVELFKKLDIPMALGTDSLASNDSLSIWDEMRFALDFFEGILSPADLFAMATIGGARGLTLEKNTGSLDIGKKADFQIVELPQKMEGSAVIEKLIGDGEAGAVYVSGKCVVER